MKIRGNAHHVAEKYLQLARDAHTSGDPVAAENYLQHAEHYFRLIASAQAAQLAAQGGAARPPGEAEADEMEDDDDVGGPPDRFASPAERAPAPPQQPQPQPYNSAPAPNAAAQQPYQQDRPAYEGGDRGQQQHGERPYNNDRNNQNRNDRNNNYNNNRNQDRNQRQDRNYSDRQDNRDNRNSRDNRQRDYRPYRDPNAPRETYAPEGQGAPGLPSFITAPARPNLPETEEPRFAVAQEAVTPDFGDSVTPVQAPQFNIGDSADRASGRSRRRRSRPQFGFDAPDAERDQPAVREESDSPAED